MVTKRRERVETAAPKLIAEAEAVLDRLPTKLRRKTKPPGKQPETNPAVSRIIRQKQVDGSISRIKHTEEGNRHSVYLPPEMKELISREFKRSRLEYYVPGNREERVSLGLKELSSTAEVALSAISELENGKHNMKDPSLPLSILRVLHKAPSGVVPRLPDGTPMRFENFLSLYAARDDDRARERFLAIGIELPKYSEKGLFDMARTPNKEESSVDCSEEQHRVIALMEDYADELGIDTVEDLVEALSEDSKLPNKLIQDLYDCRTDPLDLTIQYAMMLARTLPNPEGSPGWDVLEFIHYVTGKEVTRKVTSLGERSRLTLREVID